MLEMKGGATAPNSGPAHVCSKPSNDSAKLSENSLNSQARSGFRTQREAALALLNSDARLRRSNVTGKKAIVWCAPQFKREPVAEGGEL